MYHVISHAQFEISYFRFFVFVFVLFCFYFCFLCLFFFFFSKMCISQTNEFWNRNNSLFVLKRFKVYFMFMILKLKWQNHLCINYSLYICTSYVSQKQHYCVPIRRVCCRVKSTFNTLYKSNRGDLDGLYYGILRHFQQYFSYIVAVSFIGGGNRSTWRKPPTCRESLTNFFT